MFNADLVGNGQGLYHGKRNTFYFFGLFLGTGGVVFSKESECFAFILHYSHNKSNSYGVLTAFFGNITYTVRRKRLINIAKL